MEKMSLSVIAHMAGVSKQIVYMVLNNRQYKRMKASPQTRERILKIARESGYVAPKSAKELFSGKSDNIGIIFHKIVPPFSKVMSHLQQEARRRNLEITPYITDGDENLENHYLNSARDGRVDAIIAISLLDGSPERYQRSTKPPYNLKILSYSGPLSGVPTIHFNETEAGRLAAEHLIAKGCKKPAFFGGFRNSTRARGFVQYFRENNLPDPLIYVGEKYTAYFPEGKILAREFLKSRNLPDGVFASNDLLAIALLSGALAKGLRVPEDMAIMGCDNTEAGLYTTPALTSIDTNISLLAKKAIAKIEGMIKGEEPKPFHTEVPVSLIVRESTILNHS